MPGAAADCTLMVRPMNVPKREGVRIMNHWLTLDVGTPLQVNSRSAFCDSNTPFVLPMHVLPVAGFTNENLCTREAWLLHQGESKGAEAQRRSRAGFARDGHRLQRRAPPAVALAQGLNGAAAGARGCKAHEPGTEGRAVTHALKREQASRTVFVMPPLRTLNSQLLHSPTLPRAQLQQVHVTPSHACVLFDQKATW